MKLLLTFFFLATFTLSGSAQNSIDGFMKLFDWVEKLDENISSIVNTENQKKLERRIAYLQSDLDDFILEKKEITNQILKYCNEPESGISEIEKKVADYNKKIKTIIKRLVKIRETITFEEELYSITQKKKITVYRNPTAGDISADSSHFNMVVQQQIATPRPDGKIAKDTLVDEVVVKNKIEWKEVEFEDFLYEIENSLQAKGGNMDYIISELSAGCDLELINYENEQAIEVLTNIRNEFRDLRKKVKEYEPQ